MIGTKRWFRLFGLFFGLFLAFFYLDRPEIIYTLQYSGFLCAHCSKTSLPSQNVSQAELLLWPLRVLWRRLVSLHVERQMVGSAEASVTLGTLEWFDPCVFPVMSRQLVRPSKAPLTALPRTPVRFLTCKKWYIYVIRASELHNIMP